MCRPVQSLYTEHAYMHVYIHTYVYVYRPVPHIYAHNFHTYCIYIFALFILMYTCTVYFMELLSLALSFNLGHFGHKELCQQ